MDKVSVLAGLLYITSEIEENKKIAIKLLNGDITLKTAKQLPHIAKLLKEFEFFYRTRKINREIYIEISEFIEKFLYEVGLDEIMKC